MSQIAYHGPKEIEDLVLEKVREVKEFYEKQGVEVGGLTIDVKVGCFFVDPPFPKGKHDNSSDYETIRVSGEYNRATGVIGIYMNPFSLSLDNLKSYVEAVRPLMEEYFESGKLNDLEGALAEVVSKKGEDMRKLWEEFNERHGELVEENRKKELFLVYLLLEYGCSLFELYANKVPVVKEFFDRLFDNYLRVIRNKKKERKEIYAKLVHEVAHKVLWEQHPELRNFIEQFHKSVEGACAKVSKELLTRFYSGVSFYEEELGKKLDSASSEEEVEEAVYSYFDKKVRLTGELLGEELGKAYEIFVRLNGAEENIAYAITSVALFSTSSFGKLLRRLGFAKKVEPLDAYRIYLYALHNCFVRNKGLRKAAEWFRKHKFSEILKMSLEELIANFS